jgi:predicted nucleic acid-binding protein
MLAWDTTVVSRLYPGGPLEQRLLEHLDRDEPVAIAAPTAMEVVTGVQAAAGSDTRLAPVLTWLTRVLASSLVEVLALDRSAAILAGRLRALHPTPPTGARRKGAKPEHRAGWILDIQIASCAWTHGRELVTDNTRDFEILRDLIAELYPGASPLSVIAAPPAPVSY